MKKLAFIFPGQGSQYVGMMKELYDAHDEVKEIFERASGILNYDIKKTVFNGPEDQLRQTIITQPAIFLSSVGCIEVLKKTNPGAYDACAVAAGHSLGEYSALYLGGVFNFTDGLRLVQKRAEYIYSEGQKSPGAMAAVIGMDESALKAICDSVSRKSGLVEMVNFNTASQIVVSGVKPAVGELVTLVNSQGKAKAVPLNVSGAFHSSLMKNASVLLTPELDKVKLNDARIQVISNYDAQVTTKAGDFRQKLLRQVYSPVLWLKSMEKIIASGVDTFVEIGPGKVLSGMLRKINRDVKLYNVENCASLENLKKALLN